MKSSNEKRRPTCSVESPQASKVESEETRRLKSLRFKRSTTQPDTERDGNCGVHCLLDQLKKVGHPEVYLINSHDDLRTLIVKQLPEMLMNGHLFWADLGTPKGWMDNMMNDGVWIDEMFLGLQSIISIKIK